MPPHPGVGGKPQLALKIDHNLGSREVLMSTSEGDETYRSSVRNMVFILIAIVLVIFAAIFVPPVLNPLHEQFSREASTTSLHDFALNLELNTTRTVSGDFIAFTIWINNTSRQVNNVTAANSWPATNLTTISSCEPALPISLGVMKGYFTTDNFSLGSIFPLQHTSPPCLVETGAQAPPLSYFLFQPYGPIALVRVSGSIIQLNVTTTIPSNGYIVGGNTVPFSGVFTAVGADEWGDVVLTHFMTTSR
jgi:hypothetical protein